MVVALSHRLSEASPEKKRCGTQLANLADLTMVGHMALAQLAHSTLNGTAAGANESLLEVPPWGSISELKGQT